MICVFILVQDAMTTMQLVQRVEVEAKRNAFFATRLVECRTKHGANPLLLSAMCDDWLKVLLLFVLTCDDLLFLEQLYTERADILKPPA